MYQQFIKPKNIVKMILAVIVMWLASVSINDTFSNYVNPLEDSSYNNLIVNNNEEFDEELMQEPEQFKVKVVNAFLESGDKIGKFAPGDVVYLDEGFDPAWTGVIKRASWEFTPSVDFSSNPSRFIMPASDVEAKAEITKYRSLYLEGGEFVYPSELKELKEGLWGVGWSGAAKLESTVTIRADVPEAGYRFIRWENITTNCDGFGCIPVEFADETSSTTTFEVPLLLKPGEIEIKAIFEPIPEEEPEPSQCRIISEGQFEDQEDANGIEGASWHICEDGLLVVGEGFINWTENSSPWSRYNFNVALPHNTSNDGSVSRQAYIKEIKFTGPIIAGESLQNLLSLNDVHTIKGLEYFDTSQVTNMRNMFSGADGLTSLDLSSFDTSRVTDMSWMFLSTSSLASLDLSNFDTSSVTDMGGMFLAATSLTSLDLSSFDTSSVRNMSSMFGAVINLETLDLSNFDTSSVRDMVGMFSGARSITSLDLSSFDTSSVTDMAVMFANTHSLTNLDLSSFDTSQVRSMRMMFEGASSLTSLDLSNFDTSQVTSMFLMFSGASDLTSLNLTSFDTSQVTDMSEMFADTTSLRELSLGADFEFNTRNTSWSRGASLPSISQTAEFTGYWQNVGDGTIEQPNGSHVLTSEELMSHFVGAVMADTFVWQRQTVQNEPQPNIEITMEANPAGGTSANPTIVLAGEEIEYSVTVTNIGEETVRNISVLELNSRYLVPQDAEIMLHFNNEEAESILDSALISSGRVNFGMSSGTNGNRLHQTHNWEIDSLDAGESFTMIIPTIVSDDVPVRTVITNFARILRINDQSINGGPISSDTTHHEIGESSYEVDPRTTYTVTVIDAYLENYQTSGEFAPGDVVYLRLPDKPTVWLGIRYIISWELTPNVDFNSDNLSFIMPDSDIEVRAVRTPIRAINLQGGEFTNPSELTEKHKIDVKWWGFAKLETSVSIQADVPVEGYHFVRWENILNNCHWGCIQVEFANITSPTTTFIVPSSLDTGEINIRAIFEPIPIIELLPPTVDSMFDVDDYTQVGDELQFTVTINNPNVFNIYDFTVNEQLPEYVTFVEGSIQIQRRASQLSASLIERLNIYEDLEGVVAQYVDGEIQITFSTLPPGHTYITFDAIVEESNPSSEPTRPPNSSNPSNPPDTSRPPNSSNPPDTSRPPNSSNPPDTSRPPNSSNPPNSSRPPNSSNPPDMSRPANSSNPSNSSNPASSSNSPDQSNSSSSEASATGGQSQGAPKPPGQGGGVGQGAPTLPQTGAIAHLASLVAVGGSALLTTGIILASKKGKVEENQNFENEYSEMFGD